MGFESVVPRRKCHSRAPADVLLPYMRTFPLERERVTLTDQSPSQRNFQFDLHLRKSNIRNHVSDNLTT